MAKTATKTFSPLTGSKKVVKLVDIAQAYVRKFKLQPTEKFNKSNFNKFAWVEADQLYINFDAQRLPDDRHIGKMLGSRFDPQLCTPLVCVYRTDLKQYRTCDGLQHGSAMLATYIQCVKNGLKVPIWYAEADNEYTEHKLFLLLNRERLDICSTFYPASNKICIRCSQRGLT